MEKGNIGRKRALATMLSTALIANEISTGKYDRKQVARSQMDIMQEEMNSLAYTGRSSSRVSESLNQPVNIDPKQLESLMRAKGMKPFLIEGETVWAINEKNAKRKHQKKQ